MTSILREVCRERLNQEWAQADKSLDNYKNVMSKESKLIDEGEIRKIILDKAANKILALPFPEQAVFHLYYAFHLDDSQINEILMIPYAHGMRISMLNYLQKWTSTPEIYAGTFSRLARSLATVYTFARVRIFGTSVPFHVTGNSEAFPVT